MDTSHKPLQRCGKKFTMRLGNDEVVWKWEGNGASGIIEQ